MLPAFPFQRLANETYINGLLLLFCKNLEMKVTQLSMEEKNKISHRGKALVKMANKLKDMNL